MSGAIPKRYRRQVIDKVVKSETLVDEAYSYIATHGLMVGSGENPGTFGGPLL